MSYEFTQPEKSGSVVPDFWIVQHESFSRIESLPISQPAFVTSGSIIRDTETDNLGIDTYDLLPPTPEGFNYEIATGVLRVSHPNTGRIGFIADLRNAKSLVRRNLCFAGYDNEAASDNEKWKNEALLGAVFHDADTGKLFFQSDYYDALLPYAQSLVAFVDAVKAGAEQSKVEQVTERDQKQNRIVDNIAGYFLG